VQIVDQKENGRKLIKGKDTHWWNSLGIIDAWDVRRIGKQDNGK